MNEQIEYFKQVCKKEKWKLRRETDLKHLFETIKNLLSSAGENNRKRRNSYESEEDTVDSKRSKLN